jgi:hypothetical protein
LQRRATLRAPAVHLRPHPSEEGYMDLIVVVFIVGLAAIGYAWLTFVERA